MVSPDQLKVDITGDLMSYVGDKKISQVRETYQFTFQNQSGRLLIAAFILLKSDRTNQERHKLMTYPSLTTQSKSSFLGNPIAIVFFLSLSLLTALPLRASGVLILEP